MSSCNVDVKSQFPETQKTLPTDFALAQFDAPRTLLAHEPAKIISARELFPPLWRHARTHFDEAADNPLYARFKSPYFDPLNPSKEFAHDCHHSPLQDSITISPTPLLITREELATIRAGTAQQIKAFTKWFAELVINKSPSAELTNTIVPQEVIAEILKSSIFMELALLRRFWTGRTEHDITFLGAPDLIKAPDGKRYTLEFNVGSLGGLADCKAIHEFFKAALPPQALEHLMRNFNLESNDIGALVKAWATTGPRAKARLFGPIVFDYVETVSEAASGELVAPSHIDLEDERLRRYLDEINVFPFKPEEVAGTLTPQSPIAWFTTLANGSLAHVTPRDFNSGAMMVLNAPGTADILGNKLLLPYLDDLIRHYCKEEPLLPCVPTSIVSLRGPAGGAEFSFDLFPFKDQAARLVVGPEDRLVLKLHDGSQGAEVFPFLPETYPRLREVFAYAGADIEHDAYLRDGQRELYAAQPFVEISRLNGHLVDVRPMAISLGGGQSYVGESLWGRDILLNDNPLENDGESFKLNVSGRASELVVIAES